MPVGVAPYSPAPDVAVTSARGVPDYDRAGNQGISEGRISRGPSAKVDVKRLQTKAEDSLAPTFGVFCLLTFCFVVFSQKLPLGEASAAGAIIAAASRGKRFTIPPYYRWYLVYIVIGAVGMATTVIRVLWRSNSSRL